MKLVQKVCHNNISGDFGNGFDRLKIWAAREWSSFPKMAIVKPCKHSRCHIYFKIFIKLAKNPLEIT